MEVNLIATSNGVSFSSVKALIQHLSYTPIEKHEFASLKVISPFNYLNTSVNEISLTDSAEFEDQIRFFTRDRVIRSFINIQNGLIKQYEQLIINIYETENLDNGSRVFFETINLLSNVEVCFYLGNKKKSTYQVYYPTSEEANIERLLKKVELTKSEYDELINMVKVYINCGDSWTAERILNRLELQEVSPFIYNMKGLVYTLLDRTVEAEYYYQLWRNSGKDIDFARANYSIAMMYLRHHPAPLRSAIIGEQYLQDAYKVLKSMSEEENSMIEFETVFNRNGYALFLFHDGRIADAIAILKKGITSLSGETKILLHKTVLMYNLAQCYAKIGKFGNAILTYKEVINLDPYFPEYHAELAKCYIKTNQFKEAIDALLKALNLNPGIQELNSLLGYCYQEIGDMKKALGYYKKAYETNPKEFEIAYNYAFTLNDNNFFSEAVEILKKINLNESYNSTSIEDYFSLLAEGYINLGEYNRALTELESGLSYVHTSAQIKENIEHISGYLAHR